MLSDYIDDCIEEQGFEFKGQDDGSYYVQAQRWIEQSAPELQDTDTYRVICCLNDRKNIINDVEETYTLDEIYERADGKAHLSPELKAKDEALWELAEYIENESGENPYKLQRENRIDSAEEMIDIYLEQYGLSPRFTANGSIATLGESFTQRAEMPTEKTPIVEEEEIEF